MRTESDESNYYETERYELAYGDDDPYVVSFFRRPMNAYLQAFLDAGFGLDEVVEPTLSEAFEREHPQKHREYLQRVPDFLCIRASL